MTNINTDNEHNTTHFDAQFANVENLTWLPWVGKNYSNTRVMIIAESYYTNIDLPDEVEQYKSFMMHSRDHARGVIGEYALLGYGAEWTNHGNRRNNPTFDNLHRLLVENALLGSNDLEKRAHLWENLAYINIIQRPMWYPSRESGFSQERPLWEDFEIGWGVIAQLISILSPDICIFAGLAAANYYQAMMTRLGIQHEPMHVGEKIGHGYARSSSLTINGKSTDLFFIQHPSQYFSWERWRKFVFDQHPDIAKALSAIVEQ